MLGGSVDITKKHTQMCSQKMFDIKAYEGDANFIRLQFSLPEPGTLTSSNQSLHMQRLPQGWGTIKNQALGGGARVGGNICREFNVTI